jgi:hypothetical protein
MSKLQVAASSKVESKGERDQRPRGLAREVSRTRTGCGVFTVAVVITILLKI